jgi:hypothetical protein
MTMSESTTNEPLSRWLDLVRAAYDTQVRLGKEYADVARAAFTGRVDQGAVGRVYLKSAQREADQYWRAVSGLWFNYASAVLAAGSRASRAVLHDVSGAVRQRPHNAATSAESAESARHDVLLTGPLDGTASGTVTVANSHPDARRFVITPGALLDSSGNPLPVQVAVKPRTVSLEPGAERDVTITVELNAAVFAAGERYTSVLAVSGGDQAEIQVAVAVRAAD